MSGDSRTMDTDAIATLGTLITAKEMRDAIHLAVEPVVAGQKLLPGEDVGIVYGKAYIVADHLELGIVDPFLKGPVYEGQRFWLIVYPRTISTLRHVWTHPSFKDPVAQPIVVEDEYDECRNC